VPLSELKFGQPPDAEHALPVPPLPRNHLMGVIEIAGPAQPKTGALARRKDHEREKEKADELFMVVAINVE
jgi:hypothetical protein